MALLRECLQALRTKQRDWDVPAAAWPEPKLGIATNRRAGARELLLPLPLALPLPLRSRVIDAPRPQAA